MNHQEFGALVKSLRDDIRWSQAELAERCEVRQPLIDRIERGEYRSLLDDDVLVKLATGLQLTSLERREFLIAASGISEMEMMRPEIGGKSIQFDIKSYLSDVGSYISRITLPVFVTDSFCDILLANRCAVAFYEPPEALMAQAGKAVGSYNQVHYVFHRDSNFRELSGEWDWDRLAMVNVRHFRRRTLRFRSKSYYSALIKQLMNTRNYPYFERYWRKVVFEIQDDYSLPVVKPKDASETAFVETESLLALTPYGDLYMHQLLPLNKSTERRFRSLLQKVGSGYQAFAPMPDQRK
jgi:transcriptional regulator with XRE-family HTH domain